MKNHLLILVGSCAVAFSSIAQTTLTLQPDGAAGKDTEVMSCVPCGYDVRNFKNKADFNAMAWTNNGNLSMIRSLIEFNLTSIPISATVIDARLSLYFNPTSGEGTHSGSNAAYLRRITAAWDEAIVTWNNQPPATTVNQISLVATASSTQDHLNINVTAVVQDMVSNPATNFGWMLCLQNEAVYRKLILASSDNTNAALRPKLVVTYNAPLPVELVSFEAENSASGIQLKWATASETNNKGFEVERTSSAGDTFEKIAWIDGHGTTTSTHLYNFEDSNIKSGLNYYYRLKQIDWDGNSGYSKIVLGIIPVSQIDITVQPNPFSENTGIIYKLDENARVRLEVHNLQGQKTVTLLDKFHEAGNYRFQFNPASCGYAPGVFVINLFVNNNVFTKRVVEIK